MIEKPEKQGASKLGSPRIHGRKSIGMQASK